MKVSADYRMLALDALRGKWKTAVLTGIAASALGATIVSSSNSAVSNSNQAKDIHFELFSQPNGGRLLAVLLAGIVLWAVLQLIVGGAAQLGYAHFNLNLVDGKDAAISDGRGFEEFIRCVLFQYLKNCGFPVENDGSVRGMDTRWSPEESANGYEQLADREFSPDGIWKKPEAVHAPEVQWGADGSEVVTEVTFPFSQLHDYVKSIGVSPLSVLAPLMMKAFDDKFGGTDKPVIAEIPVDLRPLLPTLTTRYFICFIDLPYFPEYRDLPNDEVFRRTKAFLKDQMQREQLLYRAKAAADRCESLHEADMPLAEKMQAAQKVTTDFVLEDSFLITNVGRFALPESCRPYVLDYGAILPCAVQPFALLISSYGDKMKLSVAQRDHDMQVVEDLCAGLRQLGIQPETLSYPFVVTRYNGLECGM